MPRKYRRWSRAEYDQLEKLVNAGYRYADIAKKMGRELNSIIGAAQRLGLMSSERRAWRLKKDWSDVDRLLTDCIESRLMTITQASKYMGSIGRPVGVSMLYKRLRKLPPDVQRRARDNATRRMFAVCQRVHRQVAAKRAARNA